MPYMLFPEASLYSQKTNQKKMAIDEDYDASSNVKDYVRRYETPYQLEKSEKDSIASINKTMERGYSNADQADEHFQYLTTLEKKLINIHIEEQKYGIINNTIANDIAEVGKILAKLGAIIRGRD